MTERITAEQFLAASGLTDWRVLASGEAASYFQTGRFGAGVDFVNAIGLLADAANHHPDVDLRYRGVTVRLTTHDAGGLSQRDVELARQISDAAHTLGFAADPAGAGS